jgi:hypothetical protein
VTYSPVDNNSCLNVQTLHCPTRQRCRHDDGLAAREGQRVPSSVKEQHAPGAFVSAALQHVMYIRCGSVTESCWWGHRNLRQERHVERTRLRPDASRADVQATL